MENIYPKIIAEDTKWIKELEDMISDREFYFDLPRCLSYTLDSTGKCTVDYGTHEFPKKQILTDWQLYCHTSGCKQQLNFVNSLVLLLHKMYNASDKRKIKYATDPEYRKKELQRVALAKTKKEFRDWQRQYNREYYHNKRKDKMREKSGKPKKPEIKRLKVDPAADPLHVPGWTEDQGEFEYQVGDSFDGGNEDSTQHEANVDLEKIPEPKEEPLDDDDLPSGPTERRIARQVDMCAMLEIQIEYKCKRCSQRFLTLDQATDHVKTKHAMGYECGKCSAEFTRLRQLMQHMTREHPPHQMSTVKKPVIKSVVQLSAPVKKAAVPVPVPLPLPQANPPKVFENYIAKKQKATIDKANKKPVETAKPVDVQPVAVEFIEEEEYEPVEKRKRGRPPKLIKTPPKIVPQESLRKRGRPRKEEEKKTSHKGREAQVVIEYEDEEEDNESLALNRVTRQAARAHTRKLLEDTINEALEDFEEESETVIEPQQVAMEPAVPSGPVFYSCTVCSVSFLEEKYYQQHMDAHLVAYEEVPAVPAPQLATHSTSWTVPAHTYPTPVIEEFVPPPGSTVTYENGHQVVYIRMGQQ